MIAKTALAATLVIAVGATAFAQLTDLDKIFTRPGGSLKATTEDGQTLEQPVGDSVDAELGLSVEIPEEVQAGQPLPFAVTVIGDSFRTVLEARITLDVTLKQKGEPVVGATGVRIARAALEGDAGQAPIDCSTVGPVTCKMTLGAGREIRITGSIATAATTPEGSIVLLAQAFVQTTERAAGEAEAKLVAKRQLSNAGLRVGLESDSDLGAQGVPFAHVVTVENSATSEDATEVIIDIRQRIGLNYDGKLRRLLDESFTARPAIAFGQMEYSCSPQKLGFRCTVARLAAGQSIKFPIEIAITKPIPERQWGRVETQARVFSAENDPQPRDNFAKTSTMIVSDLPQIALLFRVPDGKGGQRVETRNQVRPGESFVIGAKFMDIQVEPERVVVNLTVRGQPAREVTLRLPLNGSSRVYRSEPFTVVAPGDKTRPTNSTAIAAVPGNRLVVSYRTARAEASVVRP